VASRFRTWALVGLVVVLVAALAAGVWFTRAGAQVADERTDREQAMAQASQFLLRMGTYGPDLLEGTEMPEYRARVREVITPKFAVSFEEQAGAAEQLVAQAGAARTAEIYATGVQSLAGHRATVLVAGQFAESWTADPATAPRGKDSGKSSGKSSGRNGDEDGDKGGSTVAPEPVAGEPIPFRLLVKLVKVDGTWLVDDFSAPADTPQSGTPDQQTDGPQPGQEATR